MTGKAKTQKTTMEEDCDAEDKVGNSFIHLVGKTPVSEGIKNALTALTTVRKPGQGELNLSEAADVVIEQSLAYEYWREFGSPTGVIEVWVEDRKVMTLEPGKGTDLKGVCFKTPSLTGAVVQVVRRADAILDTVVLLNAKLPDISLQGETFEQNHSNIQTVWLNVKPEGKDDWRFWLGFSPVGAVPNNISKWGRLKVKAATFRQRLLELSQMWNIPVSVGATALVVAIGFMVFTVSAQKQTNQTGQTKDMPAGQLPGYSIASSSECPSPPAAANRKGTDNSSEAVTNASMIQTTSSVESESVQKDKVLHRLPATRVEVIETSDEVHSTGESVVNSPKASPEPTEEDQAEVSPWETQRLLRLAEMRSLLLQVADSSQMDSEQAKELIASVSKALHMAGIVAVIDKDQNKNTDGVMLVRFESDPSCFGAILAEVRDRAGNFLWQGHAGCRSSADGRREAMFNDASARLVSTLPARERAHSILRGGLAEQEASFVGRK